MEIHEVQASHTPNDGRGIWNANDKELENRLNSLALNVKAAPYDAKGDGVSDDRPAIQMALDACHVAGGGYIFLPPGTYALKTGPILLRDKVNIIGAGMYAATMKLGPGVNTAVITDERAGVSGAYAFGIVRLANFGIDGGKVDNPQGQEGIFTTAYYSTFENLHIRNCQTHGIRFGFSGMANYASQNRIVGCRVARCSDTGLYLDINGIDSVISESYIHECDYGVVISNGGIRLVNNDIFGHRSAAIQVKQTSYGSIIAANDLNANKRHAIHITRTTYAETGPWSQMLIADNTILGDGLEADNLYDAIYVETTVPRGITQLTIVGNKVWTRNTPHRYRYGINLENNVTWAKCVANHIHNIATARYNVGSTCSDIEIDSLGGGQLEPPAVPASGTPLTNPYHVPVTVHITGGAVMEIGVGGGRTGLTSGSFRLPARQAITLVYTAAPTWTWFAD